MRDGRIVAAHAFFDSVAFNELWMRVAPADEAAARAAQPAAAPTMARPARHRARQRR